MLHTSLCIGGRHPQSPIALGAAPLDFDNFDEEEDLCAVPEYGVFPHAIGELWGQDPLFQQLFAPLLPALGGTPIGEDAQDAAVLAEGFDPGLATPAQRARAAQIEDALDAFAQVVAVATAHEVGHTLGLSAPGPPPAGLYGGSAGATLEHDVTPQGEHPRENFIMNFGGTFSFAEITGREGFPKPFFRAISWAYLTNRLVRNDFVTALLPAPRIFSVTPNPAGFESAYVVEIRVKGEALADAQRVELVAEGRRSVPVLELRAEDDRTLRGLLHVLFSPPGRYDVLVTMRDEQTARLVGGLELKPWVQPERPHPRAGSAQKPALPLQRGRRAGPARLPRRARFVKLAAHLRVRTARPREPA
jgi:hypothetical protein